MVFILIDEWGNPYTTSELNATAKQQVADGILNAIRIDAVVDVTRIKAISPEISQPYEVDKEENWENVLDFTKFSAEEEE